MAPTIKITDDAKFPLVGNGDAQVTNVRQSAAQAQAPYQPGTGSRQLSSPVPLFPPVPPASVPPPDVMPRTPSLAPSVGAAMPRAMSQPPQMPAPAPAPLPRAISSPPGAQGSQPRPSQGLTVQDRPSARNVQAAPARPAAPAPVDESGPTPRRGGRRWGVIVVLLIIDLGLAGSGGFMLLRGLAGDVALPPTTSQPKAP